MIQEAIDKLREQQSKVKERSPQWMVAQQLMDLVRAEPQCAEILAQDLEVELGSGSGELVNVEAEACRLSTVSAPVTYTGSGRQMEVCTVSGPVRAELSACPEEGTFQAVSGSLEVALPDNPGFEARCQSLSGTFVSEFPGKSAQGVLYGAGGPLLQFSTTSGDVHIQRRSGSAL